MDNQKWTCSCGAENEAEFCGVCGSAKSEANDINLKTQTDTQPEQQNEFENENEKSQIEYRKREQEKKEKFEKATEEYEKICTEIEQKEIRKWGKSWVVLAIAILLTLSLVFTLVSTFTSLKFGLFSNIKNIVNILFSVLICIGFWICVAQSKNYSKKYNVKGINMINVLMIIKLSILCIIFLLFGILYFYLIHLTRPENAGIKNTLIYCVIVGTIGGVIAGIITIIEKYYESVLNFGFDASRTLSSNTTPTKKKRKCVFFFFVIAGFNLLVIILKLTVLTFVSTFINNISSTASEFVAVILNGLISMLKINAFSIVSGFVNVFTYIFLGVLAIKFYKIEENISFTKSAIHKPKV